MFDLTSVPAGTPNEWAQAANIAMARLQARKVSQISYEVPTQLGFCCRWIAIYTQAHIRRGLSLLASGIDEIGRGRTLAAALCARALLEDAALLFTFNRDVLPLLDQRDVEGLDRLIIPRALATRNQREIERHGEEVRARNILTAIDKMAREHPNVRPVYDELSEVCHPNSLGVLWHFSEITGEGDVAFDDGQRMRDPALHHLIFCGLVFATEEVAIERIERLIETILGEEAAG
ncbi:hypothetical protein [Bradyrhizobium sp. RT7b]|uniref:hypothetical protein n=1 Tax=unclassified Bradyrhizobium TaxID=2631580 RepID=UPI0033910F4F